jgi:hypothetical protein
MRATALVILALSLATSLQAAETSSPPKTNGLSGQQGNSASTAGILLYDNGNTDINSDSGNEFTNWRQADDFEIAVSDNATSAEADWFIAFDGAWDGTIEWIIYLDSAGSPGAVHAQGTGSNIVTVPIGNAQGFEWFNSRWDLGQSVALTGGQRYWLALHFSSDCLTRDDLYWAYSADQNFNFSQEQLECTGDWIQFEVEDRAFKLYGQDATPVDSATWGAIKSQYLD